MTKSKGGRRRAAEHAIMRQQQQPPLPRGLPPRPPNGLPQTTFLGAGESYRHGPPGGGYGPLPPRPDYGREPDSMRIGGGGGESYRPNGGFPPGMREFRGREVDYRPRSPVYERGRSPPRHHFQDNNHRPSYDAPGTRYDDRAQGYRAGPEYQRGPPRQPSPDHYRPENYRAGTQSRDNGFNFQYQAPQGLDFSQRNRPRSPPRNTFNDGSRNNHNRGGGGWHSGRGRGGYIKVGASDREFLKTNRDPTPELMPGMEEAINAKYVAVSDGSGAEMDISGNEGQDNTNEPTTKRSRPNFKAADADDRPQWSNPDPYTVLPPVDEAERKKKDIVGLIRNSRVTTENAAQPEAITDDFLSFDMVESEPLASTSAFGEPSDASRYAPGVQGAPTGPRNVSNGHVAVPVARTFTPINGHQQIKHENLSFTPINGHQPAKKENIKPEIIDLSESPPGKKLKPPVGAQTPVLQVNGANKQNNAPGKKPDVIDLTSDPNSGNRKRKADDMLNAPPDIHDQRTGKGAPSSGEIAPAWKIVRGEASCPWIEEDHSKCANMGVWLHREIVDFYNYVKPRDFEAAIRTKLVHDIGEKIQQRFDARSDVLSFGSFPAGLYLPTADMDLVLVSDRFVQSGYTSRVGWSRKNIFGFANFVKTEKMALDGRVEAIVKAKVPIVKYVDRVTGLKVDVSFENETGLIANKTFQDWQREFPAMPILVSLIKHLLAMRGLNEPANGGIGGFSVICLVVSMFQMMPQVQSRSLLPEDHLGEMLMEFLDLYGNKFSVLGAAISLKPPGYISKASMSHTRTYKGAQDRFTILDPNRVDNDIAGGSSNTPRIRKCFSDAYTSIQRRMASLQHSNDRTYASLLEPILGGNYSSFRLQREHLKHVHEKLIGPA